MRVGHKIRIAASTGMIYDFLMDIDNRASYIPALEKVVFLDPLPVKKGTRYVEVAKIAGKRFETTYEITQLEQGRKIGAKTIDSIFPIQVTLEIQPEGGQSILVLFLQFELSGIYRFGKNIIRKIVDQQAKEILRKIKRNVESGSNT